MFCGGRLPVDSRRAQHGRLGKTRGRIRRENKIEAIVLTADLSLPETPKQIFEELSAQKISVDVLVNNAGFGAHGAFVELPLPRQLEMIQVNITALTELTGLFLPGMIQRKRGGILNVGSVAGFLPGPGMAVYYATKAFVLSFTEALAEELEGTGVKVSVLCPGRRDKFRQCCRKQKCASDARARHVGRKKSRATDTRRFVAVGRLQFPACKTNLWFFSQDCCQENWFAKQSENSTASGDANCGASILPVCF